LRFLITYSFHDVKLIERFNKNNPNRSKVVESLIREYMETKK